MKKNYHQRKIICSILFLICLSLSAQVGINIESPHPNAQLEVFSESKGVLLPRLSTDQRDGMLPQLTESSNGLTIFNATTKCLEYYDGEEWISLCGNNTIITEPIVDQLNCSGAQTGSFTANQYSSGTKTISYEGGNGGTYSSINIPSTGVTGLTATAPSGRLSNGSGSINLTVYGTPNSSGTANFTVNLGGKTCTFSITVGGQVSNTDVYTVIQIGSSARELPRGIPIIGTEPRNGGVGTGRADGPGVTTELLQTVLSDVGKPIEFLSLIPNRNSIEGLQKIFDNTTADRRKREVIFIYSGYNLGNREFTATINRIINQNYVNKGKIYLISADENAWTAYPYFSSNNYGKENAYRPIYSIDGNKLIESGETFPTKYGNVTSSGTLSSRYWGNSLNPPSNAVIVSNIRSANTRTAIGMPIIFKDMNYNNGKVWVFGDTDAYWQRDTGTFGAQPYLNTSCTSNNRQRFTCNLFHYITRKNLGLSIN